MKPYYEKDGIVIYHGDSLSVLQSLPDGSVNCCVTSPPYWGLRDYGVDGQLGQEKTPDDYVARMVELFREVRRVMADDGTLWMNLGDSYNGIGGPGNQNGGAVGPTAAMAIEGTRGRRVSGLKPKDLCGIPWRVAFALQADGWFLRQDIIWAKPNPMPESVTDRCTKAHEYLFLMSKSGRYWFDAEAVKERATSDHPAGNRTHKYADQYEVERGETQQHRTKGGLKALAGVEWETRNRRSVWTVPTCPFPGAHFAVFPPKLIEPCILAGCPEGGTVLDPFNGSGTTCWQARELGRNAVGIDLNDDYCRLAVKRLAQGVLF